MDKKPIKLDGYTEKGKKMTNDILYKIRKLHGRLNEMVESQKSHTKYKAFFDKNPQTVFLVMTPEHRNIGDLAIAYAEVQFLNRLGIKYIELTDNKCKQMRNSHQLNALDGFPIIVNGGGNLGTLWPKVENIQRDIIKANPHSPILFMPNTIYYEKTDLGQKEFEKSKHIYNAHQNLFLYAREKQSYDVMKQVYKNVKLMPDIVLWLQPYYTEKKRRGCLLCLRNDIEKTLTEVNQEYIETVCKELFDGDVNYTDMIAAKPVNPSHREAEIFKKFDQFSSAQLVITDRLHGMVFCAITGTPCLVINSLSPKVKGCYEWIKELPYIRFVDDLKNLKEEFKEISQRQFQYDNSNLKIYYEELGNDIMQLIK